MPTLQNTDDSKTNLNKYIYKYTLFLDWKIQYCYQFSPKMIYRFNIISTKISAGFFYKNLQTYSKMYTGRPKNKNNQNSFEKTKGRRTYTT